MTTATTDLRHRVRPARTNRRCASRGGFTLLEAIIAMSLVSVAMAMILGFFVETTSSSFVSEQKNKINHDIRKLTNEMATNARQANYFLLYSSFQTADRNTIAKRLYAGNSGDFLVLVYQGERDLTSSITAPRPIERIVGYYRAPKDPNNPASVGPVRRFILNIPTADQLKTVEELLPPVSQINTFSEVIELSEGLADQRLFFNFWDRSVMINGKIIHGNDAKRVTDTYNFTISPRG
jgi:prepilin-type N-terminal cleavage/methylation domain-containing protein